MVKYDRAHSAQPVRYTAATMEMMRLEDLQHINCKTSSHYKFKLFSGTVCGVGGVVSCLRVHGPVPSLCEALVRRVEI